MSAAEDNININVKVTDQGSVPVEKFRKNVRKSTQDIADSFKKASSSTKDFLKNTLKISVGFVGITAALTKGVQTVKNWITSTSTFQAAWANVTTLVDNAKTSLAGVKQKILDMAGPLGSATDLTKGLWQAISGGIKPARSLLFIHKAAQFAKAGVTQVSTAVDIGTTVLNAYGMKTSEVGRVFDMLFETNKRAKTSIDLLSRSMGQVIGSAATVGISFAELNSAVVALTLGGVKTSESMTSLKAIIANIGKPTAEAAKTAERLGIDFSIAGLKSKGFAGFLSELTAKVKGNTQAQIDLFGSVDAFNAIAILTSQQGIKRFNEAMKGMENSVGNTKEAFKKQMEAFSNSWQGLKDKLEAIFIKTLLPLLESAAQFVAKNAESIANFVKGAIAGFKSVLGLIWKFKDVVVLAGKAWLTYFVATKVTAWGTALITALSAAKSGFKGLLANMTRFVDIFKAARSFGHGFFSSITHAAEMSGVKIGFLSKRVSGLKGVLKSLGPVAVAAWAGWKIGKLIGEISVVKKAAQSFFDYLETYSVKTYHMLSMLQNMTKQQIDTSAAIEKVKALARAHGIHETNLKRVYIAIGQNREAYAQLSPEMQKVVDRFVALDQRHKEQLDNLRRLTEYGKKYGLELHELQRIILSIMTVNLAGWFDVIASKTEIASRASEKAKKAFDEFARSLGFVTSISLQEYLKEIQNLYKATGIYADQLERNEKLQETVWSKSNELIERYLQVGKPIPEQLQKINDRLKETYFLKKLYNSELKEAAIRSYQFESSLIAVNTALEGNRMIQGWVTDAMGKAKKPLEIQVSLFSIMPEILGEIYRTGSMVLDFFVNLGIIGESTAEVLRSIIDGVRGISAGLDQIARSQGKGVLNFLGRVSGYVQIATTAVRFFVGSLKSLMEPNWGARARKALGGLQGVTKDMEKQLKELSKEMGSTETAMRSLLAEFIRAANISSYSGFEGWAEEIKKVGNLLDDLLKNMGELNKIRSELEKSDSWAAKKLLEVIPDVDSTAKQFEDSFSALLAKAKELGYEGSKAMNDIINQARKLKAEGVELPAVFEYLNEQYRNYAGALGDYVKGITDQDSFNRAIQHTTDFIAAMQAEGKSMMEIFDLIGPSLDDIMKKAQEAGYDTKGLSDVLGLRQFVNDNKEALGQMDASLRMMQALGNAGLLTQDRFKGFQNDLYKTYMKISDGEKHSKAALESLLPTLAQQVWYAKQNNLELSKETKELLEKAKNQGLNVEGYKTQEMIQAEIAESTKSMAQSMQQLVNLMSQGAGAMGTMADNTAKAVAAAGGFSNMTAQDILGGMNRGPGQADLLAGSLGGDIPGYSDMDKFLDKFTDKNKDALNTLSNSMDNLNASTKNTLDTQKILGEEITNTASQGKNDLDNLASSMGGFTQSTKNSAGAITESMDAVISKTKDTANSYSKITDEIIESTKAAKKLSSIPPPTIPGFQNQNTPPPQNNNPPPVFAAKGITTVLKRPTQIFLDDGTKIVAGENGDEVLTITPLKKTLSTNTANTTGGSGGGSKKLEITLNLRSEAPIIATGSEGDIDKEALRYQVQQFWEDNLSGFAEEVVNIIDRRGST